MDKHFNNLFGEVTATYVIFNFFFLQRSFYVKHVLLNHFFVSSDINELNGRTLILGKSGQLHSIGRESS